MKKRLVNLIAAIVMIFCGLFALSSCDNKTEAGGGNEEVRQGLEYKTLNVDGTNVYGKVSNATETFSFLEEITANGASKFIVALDIYGAQQVATKTIPLSVGDNIAYIMETIDGETVKMYTVTVRRRPIYTVSFNSNGGTEVQSQQVEEDSFAAEPAAQSKAGYTFEKWNYDFSKPITQNTSVGAVWKAHTDTPYKVQYYWENANDNGYTLHESVDLQGETDTTATAQIKSYEHFSHKSTATDSGNINGNGSLVLKVYYTREMLTVTFNGYGNETETKKVKYGGKVTAPEFTRTGYTQNGWDQPIPETISENLTLSAAWQINQYTLTLVLGGGFENKTITQDYGSAIEAETPEREGYDFKEWRESDNSWANVVTIPETMPAENLTFYAKWNEIFDLSENGDTITGLTDYGKNATKLVIPEAIDGVKIVDISSAAFTNCNSAACNEKDNLRYIGSKDNLYLFLVKASQNLENFEIDSGCKYIGDQAFYEDGRLTSIEIPNGVTSIGKEAFYKSSRLTSIEIPNGVTFIGEAAFRECSGLTSITIPNSVTSIGEYAFSGCSGLKSVTIPDSVTSIGDYAFSGCSGLTSVGIPNSVISIDGCAFSGCSGLTSVTIPNSVTSIGDSAFGGCRGLTSIKIPNNVTFIGNYAFNDCSGLTSITIPDSVASIGNSAFSGCSGLTSITIPNSVTSIGESAFSGCSGLTSITIPNSVISIGDSAFMSCSSLTSITIGNSVTSIGNSAFEYCSGLTSVTIPNSVTSIGDSAFYGCRSLENITIPDSVILIGDRVFSSCSNLDKISVATGNTKYHSAGNSLIETETKTLILGCKNSVIPTDGSVTSIGDSAFSGCSGLTSITIPTSVTSIGESAFCWCSGLTSVTIPDSVTSIGHSAFSGCSQLTCNVKNNLKYLGNSENPYSYLVGATNTDITSAKIDKNCRFIGDSAFDNCSGLTSVTIPDSVTSIGNYAFYNCSGLTRITIPNSVTSIDYGAFDGCGGLEKVYFKGSAEEWDKISISSYNEELNNAARYYYSETKPTESGNFWHYGKDGEIAEW